MTTEHRTDLGNARRLVRAHGNDLRYVAGIGWHAWDGTLWKLDHAEAERRAKRTAISIFREAMRASDEAERRALSEWALASESESRLRAMLRVAESEKGVAVHPDKLDDAPFLLCVPNGVVDLRTGKMRPADRDDLMTKVTGAAYDSGARSRQWDRFLARVVPDDDLRSFLQRAAGYSLTGSTEEEVLLFVHGPAATGKSTFLEALRAAFGGYAMTADFTTFLRRRSEGPRNDVARLRGSRLVVSLEVDQGQSLAEGLVKSLTGGDTIAARFLYKESFEFLPQFKLWLSANHRPLVDDRDDALWRRIREIPFDVRIPEAQRDPRMKAALRGDPDERAAVLAWAVEGCLRWQAEGLRPPESVVAATLAYRSSMNPITNFIAEECIRDCGARSKLDELYRSYASWANGSAEMGQRTFALRLKEEGFVQHRDAEGRWWTGIRLAGDQQG